MGLNSWIKQPRAGDGDLPPDTATPPPRTINLGGKATVKMGKGDRIIVETPGGGAWGPEGGERRVDGGKEHARGEARGSVWERSNAAEGA